MPHAGGLSSPRSPVVYSLSSYSWLLAVIALVYAGYQSAFWTDLVNASIGWGGYASFRETAGFNDLPIQSLLPRLNSALPISTPIALSEPLEGNLFAKQRLTELLYPRIVNASAPHRLEFASAADFDPRRGLELARTTQQQVFFISGPPAVLGKSLIEEPLEFSLFPYLGSALAVLGLGLALGRWLGAEGTLLLPASVLSGALVIGLIATLATWLQIPVRPLVWNIAGLVSLVAFLVWPTTRKIRIFPLSPGIRAALRAPENYVLASILLLFFLTMLEHPVALWDGRSIWLFHAKQLFFSGMLSKADSLTLQWNHPEYPLLHSAFMAHFSGLSPAYNERLAALGIPVLFSAVVALVWQLLRQATSRWAGAAITLAAFFSVTHITIGGHADALVMFLLLLELLALQSPGSEPLGWLAAAAASLVKVEGFVFASLIAVTCLLAVDHLRARRGLRRPAALLVLLPACVNIAWGKAIGVAGVFHDIHWGGIRTSFFERLGVILTQTFSVLTAGGAGHHALVWEGLAGVISFLVLWISFRPRPRSAAVAIVLAFAFGSVAIVLMLITPLDLVWHVRSAMHRLLLHPALFALVAPFLFLRGRCEPDGTEHALVSDQ